jgi:hypothetical protein
LHQHHASEGLPIIRIVTIIITTIITTTITITHHVLLFSPSSSITKITQKS